MNRAPASALRLLIGALAILALVAVAPALASRKAAAGYPSSMVVIGESDATGAGSDPAHPYADTPANSWATGTNPAVDSIYQRILAVDPAIRGHNANLASDEAGIDELAGQISKALKLNPKPQLVILQLGDDIKCDSQDQSRVTQFGTTLGTDLQTLTQGDPGARIFLVSSWGTWSSYTKYLEGLPLRARLKHAGKSLCQLVASSSGQVVSSHVAYAKKMIDAYDAQLAAACKSVVNCRYDGGAAARLVVLPEYMSVDQYHLLVPGQAKLAALEWAAMSGFVNGL